MLYPDFNELVALKNHISRLSLSSARAVTSVSAGDHSSPFRGQGLEFEEVREYTPGDDIRSNIHAGGEKAKAVVDDVALQIAEIVRPKLVEDGMFFVGLDIVGSKLMEINVFTPGGLGSARQFARCDRPGFTAQMNGASRAKNPIGVCLWVAT